MIIVRKFSGRIFSRPTAYIQWRIQGRGGGILWVRMNLLASPASLYKTAVYDDFVPQTPYRNFVSEGLQSPRVPVPDPLTNPLRNLDPPTICGAVQS